MTNINGKKITGGRGYFMNIQVLPRIADEPVFDLLENALVPYMDGYTIIPNEVFEDYRQCAAEVEFKNALKSGIGRWVPGRGWQSAKP